MSPKWYKYKNKLIAEIFFILEQKGFTDPDSLTEDAYVMGVASIKNIFGEQHDRSPWKGAVNFV